MRDGFSEAVLVLEKSAWRVEEIMYFLAFLATLKTNVDQRVGDERDASVQVGQRPWNTLRDCSVQGRVLASAELGNGPGVELLQRCTRERRNRPAISFNEKHTQAQARA